MSKCLVTLVIGDQYKAMFETHFKPTWVKYADKHGYDLVIIDDYMDDSEAGRARTPHWQKCLILEHPRVREHDDAVWVDSDIIINYHTAPCIVSQNEPGRIGVVTHADRFPTPEKIDNARNRMFKASPSGWIGDELDISNADLYRKAGLPGDVDGLANTGVMVFKPGTHAPLLREVYDTCTENPYSAKENMPLSYHLFKSGLVHGLDLRFNKLWDECYFENYPFFKVENYRADLRLSALCVNTAYHNAWFLHFLAGNTRQFVGQIIPDKYMEDAWQAIFQHFEAEEMKSLKVS